METKIITTQNNDLVSFIAEIEIQSIENHIIVDLLSNTKLSLKDLNLFLPIIKLFKKNKKSFVIIASNIDFNKVSDKITIAPTLQEAHDMIEMEEIERDLENN
jgi:bifunctional ADP-heptose synthase (sugar kinase/adenylyltransferase)